MAKPTGLRRNGICIEIRFADGLWMLVREDDIVAGTIGYAGLSSSYRRRDGPRLLVRRRCWRTATGGCEHKRACTDNRLRMTQVGDRRAWAAPNPAIVSALHIIVGDMPAVPELSLPPEYLRWQERLAHEFFDGRKGQPVVMFIDLDDLQRLADPGEDPLRSLAIAVKSLVDNPAGRIHVLPGAASRGGLA